jgi:hypothetical protein
MISIFRNVVRLAVCMFLLANSVFAAEYLHRASDKCEWTLNGAIVSGDSSKLKSLNWDSGNYVKTLCLNSSGGSLVEGVAVAESIRAEEISTLVESGQNCFSACAIAFMAGVEPPEGEGIPSISRTLDVRGKLGFHRPAILLPNNKKGGFDEETVSGAYSAINAVGLLMEWLNKNTQTGVGNPIPFSLMEEMLKHEGNNMFLIDTAGKAGRWRIEVVGYQLPNSVTEQMIFDSCRNTQAWSGDRETLKSPLVKQTNSGSELGLSPEKVTEVENLKEMGYERQFDVITNQDEGGAGCRIFVASKMSPVTLEICAWDIWTDLTVGSCLEDNDKISTVSLNNLALFPSDLRLDSLPGVEKKQQQIAQLSIPASDSRTFQQLYNIDVVGSDIMNFGNLTDIECNSSCKKLGVCVAATYDRWNKFCTLKSSATELRTNSKSVSWLKAGLQARPSNRSPRLLHKKNRSFPDKAYRKVKSIDYERCASECLQDSMCMGLNYRTDGQCELVKSLSAYQPSSKSDVAYKIEVP